LALVENQHADYRTDILRDALDICRQTFGHSDMSPRRLFLRGLFATRRREYEIAIACLTRALQLAAAKELGWLSALGDVLSDNGQGDRAAAAYLRAIVLSNGLDTQYYGELSNALRQRGYTREAIAVCSEAVRLEPETPMPIVGWEKRFYSMVDRLTLDENSDDPSSLIQTPPNLGRAWEERS
jgi:tetratricopeptide (TPR) repeat protein